MSLKVSYKGVDIIDESSDCNKTLNTAGTYMEDDVTIAYSDGGGWWNVNHQISHS